MTPSVLHLNYALTLYRIEEAPYATLNLRGVEYPHWIVSHVLQGSVVTSSRGIRQTVKAGDVMVHVPGVPFDETAESSGVHQWLLFDLRGTPGTEVFHDCPVPPVVRLDNAKDFSTAFRRLLTVWQNPESATKEMQVFAGASGLLAQIIAGWETQGKPPRPEALQTPRSRFEEIVAYMQTHLADPICRTDLAHRACLHPVYFDRAFRAAHGVSPMQMLREMRLRAAQQKLVTTDETVETIACACGLGDAATFSRQFRARFGQAPGRYRTFIKRGSYLGEAYGAETDVRRYRKIHTPPQSLGEPQKSVGRETF